MTKLCMRAAAEGFKPMAGCMIRKGAATVTTPTMSAGISVGC
jgi:hypothetical protein